MDVISCFYLTFTCYACSKVYTMWRDEVYFSLWGNRSFFKKKRRCFWVSLEALYFSCEKIFHVLLKEKFDMIKSWWEDWNHCHVAYCSLAYRVETGGNCQPGLTKGNKIPNKVPLKLTNKHIMSYLFNLYKNRCHCWQTELCLLFPVFMLR